MTQTFTKELIVHTQSHDYPIVIGQSDSVFGVFDTSLIKSKQILVVTNQTIAPLYLQRLLDKLTAFDAKSVILPDGEQFKTQDSINQIYDVLMEHHFGRDCTLIALGGGVIGDMTGFAAASFMRGVDFIQVPTTLLSQVDSSVGGKTGINHALGKNMIGAFWQPTCVFADLATFATLPDREFNAGMAEVIKYGLIMDSDFLVWLSDNANNIRQRQPDVMSQMVYRACAFKAQIVGQDEKEQGRRALLNFGHTFGHAIETHMGYGNWLHGEAVAVGMVQASLLSYKLGNIRQDELNQIVHLLQSFDLPTVPPVIDENRFLDLMGHDKKVKNGKIRFVLLKSVGDAYVTADAPFEILSQTLNHSYQSF